MVNSRKKSPRLRVKPSDLTRSARRRQQRRRQQSARQQRWAALRDVIEASIPEILCEPDDELTRRELRAFIDRMNKLLTLNNPFDEIVLNLVREGYWTPRELAQETKLRVYVIREILARLVSSGKVRRAGNLYQPIES